MELVTEVFIDGEAVDDFRASNDRNLHFRSLAHAAGDAEVLLRTADGQECSLTYTYEDADPPGADGDTVLDAEENCPDDANPGQEDGDGDGEGDACDDCPDDPANDVDGDGICGDLDNCPDVANPGQEDADMNGVGDACEGMDPDPSDTLECASLSPDHGRTDGDHPIDVHGVGMLLVTEVFIDGEAVDSFRAGADVTLHLRSLPHDAGTVDVTLRTSDGQECSLPYTCEDR